MILRIDDTDLERNTDASLQSIYDGLNWLDLEWDEHYRQSERLDLHRRLADEILAKGRAYRDFTPANAGDEKDQSEGPWLFNPMMRELTPEESGRRAAAGEPFVLRFRVPRERPEAIQFDDLVFGKQSKLSTDIEDFALLRSTGMPTYHMASCADDADLGVTHIVRGQDHLSNTFKHALIFQALGVEPPKFAHLPLLTAPDGAKLSKRKHGPVVSVTTYRDAGFLPHAYVNFLCLLGWSPKDNREQMVREELVNAFRFDAVNRSNAVVNFTEEDPIDPKAAWLNAQHLRTMPLEELLPFVREVLEKAGLETEGEVPLATRVEIIRSRYATLHDFAAKGRPYFCDDFESQPEALQKLNVPCAREGLHELAKRLEAVEWSERAIEAELRKVAAELNLKPGALINASRAALTGQTIGPSAFSVFIAAGRTRSLNRLRKA